MALHFATTEIHAGDPKIIDKRTTSTNPDLFVVLLARNDSLVGHAFVALGKADYTAKACSSTAFGFYPANGKGVLGPVPGMIVENEELSNAVSRLIIRVSKEQFERVENIRAKWAKNQHYELAARDCVTFVSEVARELGLRTPERRAALLPHAFVQQIVQMN